MLLTEKPTLNCVDIHISLHRLIKEQTILKADTASSSGAGWSAEKSVSFAVDADPPQKEFLVTISHFEVYNETVKDLFNPTDRKIVVREHPDNGVVMVS